MISFHSNNSSLHQYHYLDVNAKYGSLLCMSHVFEIHPKHLIVHANDLIYSKSGPCFSKDLDEFVRENDIIIKKIYYLNLANNFFNNFINLRINTEKDLYEHCYSTKRNDYKEEYEYRRYFNVVIRYRWFVLLDSYREYIALQLFL